MPKEHTLTPAETAAELRRLADDSHSVITDAILCAAADTVEKLSLQAAASKSWQARALERTRKNIALTAENSRLRKALRDIGEYRGAGGPATPWQSIVRECGEKARTALGEAA